MDVWEEWFEALSARVRNCLQHARMDSFAALEDPGACQRLAAVKNFGGGSLTELGVAMEGTGRTLGGWPGIAGGGKGGAVVSVTFTASELGVATARAGSRVKVSPWLRRLALKPEG